MDEKPQVIYRYSVPTKLDTAYYGTICKINNGFELASEFYIQTSHDHEDPNWQQVSSISEREEILEIIKNIEDI